MPDADTDPAAVYVRTATPLAAEVDGELVMLDPATSRYFGLADTGMRIWQLLEEPRSVDDLVATLVAEYEVEPEQCTDEVMAFLDQLEQAGLATRTSTPD